MKKSEKDRTQKKLFPTDFWSTLFIFYNFSIKFSPMSSSFRIYHQTRRNQGRNWNVVTNKHYTRTIFSGYIYLKNNLLDNGIVFESLRQISHNNGKIKTVYADSKKLLQLEVKNLCPSHSVPIRFYLPSEHDFSL